MNFKKYIIYTLSISAITFLSCKPENPKPEEVSESQNAHDQEEGEGLSVALSAEQFKIAGIEIGKLETRNLTGVVHANGVLDVPPQNLVSISSPAAGYLQSSDLLQGTYVRKGQVIATIRNPDFIQWQQDYLETKHQIEADLSRLEYLEAEYRRQEELAKEKVNSGKTLQSAKADYYSLKSTISGLEARLGGQRATLRLIGINVDEISPNNFQSQISIHSPISGYVMEVNVNAGKYISNTDVLFQIADTRHLHAELTVFEKDITKLKEGQKVRFMLANESQERLATIYLLSREITDERGIRVHCHLDKEDPELIPGMYFKGVVETGSNPVLSLPTDAIVSNEGKDFIFQVEVKAESHDGPDENALMEGENKSGDEKEAENQDDHHFQMVEVKKGLTDGEFTEIILLEGVDVSNLAFVTKGAFYLLSAFKSESEGEE